MANLPEKVFIVGPEAMYEFHMNGKLYHAEWHGCCGWLFSDWKGDGIVQPSPKLYKAFEKEYPQFHDD